MLHRRTYLANRRTLDDNGELVIDINVRDPISVLLVEFRNTNGGTHNQLCTMAQCIDAIEVIDGSDVLVSLDGEQAFALTAYMLGHIPYSLVSELPSVVQNLAVPLIFGRYPGDTNYALDPSRFNNLQLRVSWNFANVNSVGATGFLTGYGDLTVIADVMEGAPTPRGLIAAREHYTFTTAASGEEYIDLPTQHPYLGILFKAVENGVALYSSVSNLELNCDAGAYIPYDMRMTDLLRLHAYEVAPFMYKHQLHVADADTVRFINKVDEQVAFTVQSQDDTVVQYAGSGVGQGALAIDDAGSAEGSDITVDALVTGFAPYGGLYLPFGDRMMESEWFPSAQFGSVRLIATQGNAGASASVVLVHARPY